MKPQTNQMIYEIYLKYAYRHILLIVRKWFCFQLLASAVVAYHSRRHYNVSYSHKNPGQSNQAVNLSRCRSRSAPPWCILTWQLWNWLHGYFIYTMVTETKCLMAFLAKVILVILSNSQRHISGDDCVASLQTVKNHFPHLFIGP